MKTKAGSRGYAIAVFTICLLLVTIVSLAVWLMVLVANAVVIAAVYVVSVLMTGWRYILPCAFVESLAIEIMVVKWMNKTIKR